MTYYSGLSFERVALVSEGAFCPESVRQWWRRLARTFQSPRGPHGVVVVDETFLRIGRRDWVLWVAVDATTLQVVHLELATAQWQTRRDCYRFLTRVRARSAPEMPIIIHDRGSWYPKTCRNMSLPHAQVAGGVRSLVECWNRQLKHRLDAFWRQFRVGLTPEQVEAWLRSYAAAWNLARGW